MDRLKAWLKYHKRDIPNWLTISRVVVIAPVCLLLYYVPNRFGYSVASFLSAYAMLTDYVDGYLSRKWGAVSDFGRLLDPVADKLLVAALLILLCAGGLGHPLAVVLIMLREVMVSALREFSQERDVVLHVSTLAKYKTTLQMLAAFSLLIAGVFPDDPTLKALGEWLLWGAALLTCYTGYDYFKATLKQCFLTSNTEQSS